MKGNESYMNQSPELAPIYPQTLPFFYRRHRRFRAYTLNPMRPTQIYIPIFPPNKPSVKRAPCIGVSQNLGCLLGVPIVRTILFGVYIGVPLFGKLPYPTARHGTSCPSRSRPLSIRPAPWLFAFALRWGFAPKPRASQRKMTRSWIQVYNPP